MRIPTQGISRILNSIYKPHSGKLALSRPSTLLCAFSRNSNDKYFCLKLRFLIGNFILINGGSS